MNSTYIIKNDKVYKINIPQEILELSVSLKRGISSNLEIDKVNKRVVSNIFVNSTPEIFKSNKVKVDELKKYIKKNNIKDIETLQDTHKAVINYTIFINDKESETGQIVKPIKCESKAILLGISENDELLYRKVREFTFDSVFTILHSTPYGINKNINDKFSIKINNISIYSSKFEFRENHKSLDGIRFETDSLVPKACTDDSVCIYSSREDNIDFNPIETNFDPRYIDINYSFIIEDYIELHDGNVISQLLLENNNKIKELPKVNDTDSNTSIPEPPVTQHEPSKPKITKYIKSTLETPNALKVVDDTTIEDNFDELTMVKKSTVINDLPEININDYVLKTEVEQN